MAHSDNKNNSNPGDGKDFLCDNPISLDEIEDGLWLGMCLCVFRVRVYLCASFDVQPEALHIPFHLTFFSFFGFSLLIHNS